MKLATISSKNQITLPVNIMNTVGLTAKSRVFIRVKGDQVVIEPQRQSVVESVGGSLNQYVTPDRLGKTTKEIEEIAFTRAAEEMARKMQPK